MLATKGTEAGGRRNNIGLVGRGSRQGEPAAAGLLQLYFLPFPYCHGGLFERESPFHERALFWAAFSRKSRASSPVDVTDKNIACMHVRSLYCTPLGPTDADVVVARHAAEAGGGKA